jgi:hypothetical protein
VIHLPDHVLHAFLELIHVSHAVLLLQELRILVQAIHLSQHLAQPISRLFHLLAELLVLLPDTLLDHLVVHLARLRKQAIHLLLHVLQALHLLRLVLLPLLGWLLRPAYQRKREHPDGHHQGSPFHCSPSFDVCSHRSCLLYV